MGVVNLYLNSPTVHPGTPLRNTSLHHFHHLFSLPPLPNKAASNRSLQISSYIAKEAYKYIVCIAQCGHHQVSDVETSHCFLLLIASWKYGDKSRDHSLFFSLCEGAMTQERWEKTRLSRRTFGKGAPIRLRVNTSCLHNRQHSS